MNAKCPVPCPHCSTIHAVALVQAGETLRCGCGHELLLPTLRELRRLAAEHDAVLLRESALSTRSARWSAARGGSFVAGCLMLVIGGYVHYAIAPQRQTIVTQAPVIAELKFDVQTLKPLEAWEAWAHFRDLRLDYRATPVYLKNREKHAELSYKLYFGWGLASIGLLAVIGSLLVPTSRPRSQRPPTPAA